MASSSSAQARSIVSPKLYDVFISHRGPDVKETLAKQFYDLFEARGYKAFLDRKELGGGDSIKSAIDNAICSSRVQIAIFSKGYAESYWCLDELLLMLQQTDALFIPVFYGVQPWELRHIDNDKSQYAAAFENYERKCRHLDKLDGWKKALASAAEISGYEIGEHHPEDLCKEIVSRVVRVMEKSIPLHVAKYPVGLDELVQDFERRCSKTVGSVGIFGLGGSGKTTLAKELFNKKRSDYHASCFLFDVRESHARGQLHGLQRQLLKDLLLGKEKIMSVHHGIGKLKDHLGRAKHLRFLIVLDDIDRQEQLDALLPEEMLGYGNLVIITTRDQSVLRGVDIRYEMKLMDGNHARDLFCSHAFRGRDPPAAYDNMVQGFVEFCGGLPLSLMVLGAHVYNRDHYYWNLELKKVKKIQPGDIMERLKISFDGLDPEEKQIFIDIACFFNKKTQFNAVIIWKASGWSAEHALEILQQKCLIERDHGFRHFQMHDHLRDLGRQIADELGPARLWQPELLRSTEAKGFKQILAETKGSRCLHSFKDSSLGRRINCFIAETSLLSLEIHDGDNKLSFPSWIPLPELHYLRVSRVDELWSSFQQQLQINAQASFQLRQLWIMYCPSSQKLPDSIQMLSHLEELWMFESLQETDTRSFVQSLKQLSNLRSLHLWNTEVGLEGNLDLSGRMDRLESIHLRGRMDRLESIDLCGLKNISKLVISGEMCPRLQTLDVQVMENLKEIELKQLGRLTTLKVDECRKLEKLSDLSSLMSLQELEVKKCARLKSLSNLESVEVLDELPGSKSLIIEMPDDGCALALHGLTRMLSLKRIYLTQKVMYDVSVKLKANLFSKMIDAQAVSEIERGEYDLKIKSSLNAITIYALLITSKPNACIRSRFFHFYHPLPSHTNWLITVLVAENDNGCILRNTRIKKGLKATVKVGEEGKALIVMQRIVDQLYRDGPELASYYVVKRKRKKH